MEKTTFVDCGTTCWLKSLVRTCDSKRYQVPIKQVRGPANDLRIRNAAKQLYTPLLPWQTRLLRIEPGAISDELQCKLFIADLVSFKGVGLSSIGEIIQYEALSYAWGQLSFPRIVHCNGIKFPVTENLAEALSQIRLQNRARYVWSDAICINQTDADEKSRQVAIMFVIYQKATRVLAWLGMPKPDGICILEFLEHMSVHQEKVASLKNLHDEECIKVFKHALNGVAEILSRPWFSRTWVRQEVFANHDLDLICGESTTSFENFCCGLETIQKFEQFNEHLGIFLQAPNLECLHLMRISKGRPGKSLKPAPEVPISAGVWLSGILAGSRFDATDAKDKVYGATAMLQEQSNRFLNAYCGISDPPDSEFPIDYKKPLSIVYQDTVKFLINKHHNLHSLCVFHNTNEAGTDLPRWAIDLRQNIPRYYLQTHVFQPDLLEVSNMITSSKDRNKKMMAMAMNPQSVGSWKSFQGRFEAPIIDLEEHDVLRVSGRSIGTIGDGIEDVTHLANLPIGKLLQRMPLPSGIEFFVKHGKRFMKSSEAIIATVDRLMRECLYKCVRLVLSESLINLTAEPSEMCTILLVPSQAEKADIVAFLHGSLLPFVLRPNLRRPGYFRF